MFGGTLGNRVTLTVLAILAVLVPACGQGQSPAAVLGAVPDQVDEAGSSRFSMQIEMESPDLPGGSATMTAEGEGRWDPPLVHMTMDMSSLMQGVPGAGDATMEMILDDTIMYMRMDLMQRMLPEGKTWISMDLETAGEQAGLDLSQLMQAGTNDPSRSLEVLRGVAEGEVEEVGTEEVRGEPTTHYRATIDMERAIERMPEETREDFRVLMEEAGFPDTLPVEVWMDDGGLPRRYVQSQELTPPGAGSALQQTITMEMFDYGAEVDVEPPPAEETVDASELGTGAGEA